MKEEKPSVHGNMWLDSPEFSAPLATERNIKKKKKRKTIPKQKEIKQSFVFHLLSWSSFIALENNVPKARVIKCY